MKARKILTLALLAFVASSLLFLVLRTPHSHDRPPAVGDAGAMERPDRQVLVTYFHRTVRCPTCRKFEAWGRKAVEDGFPGEVAAGKLAWRVINVDEPGNEHFIEDYGLVTKSIIVSETRRGEQIRWKNLDRIWDLAGDENAFLSYVRDEIASFLAAHDQGGAAQ